MNKQQILKRIEQIEAELKQLKKELNKEETKKKQDNYYIVYCHTLPNKKHYIGIAKDTEKRWKSGKGYETNTLFYKDIQKYKWDNIKHDIVYKAKSRTEAEKIETMLIILLDTTNAKNGYNKKTYFGGARKTTDFKEWAKEQYKKYKNKLYTKVVEI